MDIEQRYYWLARILTTPEIRVRIADLARADRRTIAATVGMILERAVTVRSTAA